MFNSDVQTCSVCRKQREVMFSNRPMHKGTQETLLICLDCVVEARESGVISAETTPCQWCGSNKYPRIAASEYVICNRCLELCQTLEV